MQVRNSSIITKTGDKFQSSQSFGFHMAGEPAVLYKVLQNESPEYFKWVANKIKTDYAQKNTQAASDIMDFFQYNGLIKSCSALIKKEPDSADIYREKIKEFSLKAKELLSEIRDKKSKNPHVFNMEKIHEVVGLEGSLEYSKVDFVI